MTSSSFVNLKSVDRDAGSPSDFRYSFASPVKNPKRVSLISLEMPLQSLNVRSPYNVFTYTKDSTEYTATVAEGVYFIDDLLTALSAVLDEQGTTCTFQVDATTLRITATAETSITINGGTLASSLGFVSGQAGTSITAVNSYFISLDTFVGIQIANLPSNFIGKGPHLHFKVPLSSDTSYIMLHYENATFGQFIDLGSGDTQLSYLDIKVIDSQGNIFPLQGIDWSMTLRIDYVH